MSSNMVFSKTKLAAPNDCLKQSSAEQACPVNDRIYPGNNVLVLKVRCK